MQKGRVKKTLNIWQLKWSLEGKKRRNKKSRRRRRETSLREEWVTGQREDGDGGGRGERRFWSFGDMCCRYGHRRRRAQAASLDIQVAALLVEDGAAFDAAFRHSFPGGGGGGGGTETESGHSEFLTNTAAATELPSKRVGGREGGRETREARFFCRIAPLSLFPSCKSKSALLLSFPGRGGLRVP